MNSDNFVGTRNTKAIPTRRLYTLFRVCDLERSICFYEAALGMGELYRETCIHRADLKLG